MKVANYSDNPPLTKADLAASAAAIQPSMACFQRFTTCCTHSKRMSLDNPFQILYTFNSYKLEHSSCPDPLLTTMNACIFGFALK
jgi:hypothetical protein